MRTVVDSALAIHTKSHTPPAMWRNGRLTAEPALLPKNVLICSIALLRSSLLIICVHMTACCPSFKSNTSPSIPAAQTICGKLVKAIPCSTVAYRTLCSMMITLFQSVMLQSAKAAQNSKNFNRRQLSLRQLCDVKNFAILGSATPDCYAPLDDGCE